MTNVSTVIRGVTLSRQGCIAGLVAEHGVNATAELALDARSEVLFRHLANPVALPAARLVAA